MYPVVHKIKIKTNKQTSKLKKMIKILNATGLEPTSLSAKTLDYPLGYRRIVINFIQISNWTTIKSALFTKIHEDWVKGHWIFICLGSILTNNIVKWPAWWMSTCDWHSKVDYHYVYRGLDKNQNYHPTLSVLSLMTRCTSAEDHMAQGHTQHRGIYIFDCCTERYKIAVLFPNSV